MQNRPTVRLRRSEVPAFLAEATKDPAYIFSVTGPRRNDLLKREAPTDQYKSGKLVKGPDGKNVVIEKAGTIRTMTCLRRFVDPATGMLKETKHHKPQGKGLRFDPASKGLFGPVGGMYNDAPKTQPNGEVMPGRYGDWRPFCFIDVNTVQVIENKGTTYVVEDDAAELVA
jgi:hypothetical protein